MKFIFIIICVMGIFQRCLGGQVVIHDATPSKVVNYVGVKPCTELTVEMVVSDAVPLTEFLSMMIDVQTEFADVSFTTVTVDPGAGVNASVPGLNAVCDGVTVPFRHTMNIYWVRRWLRDARRGIFELVRKISVVERYHDHYPVAVHILASKRPQVDFLAKRMPSVGFAWSTQGAVRFRNTIITKDVFGKLYMRHDHSFNNLLHTLLPPLIPVSLAKSSIGNEIMSGFAKREIHIVTDGVLPSFWDGLISEYPLTAFILYGRNETTRLNDSVWYSHRSVDFMWPSVGPDVRDWLSQLSNGTASPVNRRSTQPTTPHAFFFDVTGDNFWNWTKSRSEAYVYLYEQHASACDEALQVVPNAGVMNIRANDHELLPDAAEEGMVLHIRNYGRNIVVMDCASIVRGSENELKDKSDSKDEL